jgi:hypothetical protein
MVEATARRERASRQLGVDDAPLYRLAVGPLLNSAAELAGFGPEKKARQQRVQGEPRVNSGSRRRR